MAINEPRRFMAYKNRLAYNIAKIRANCEADVCIDVCVYVDAEGVLLNLLSSE